MGVDFLRRRAKSFKKGWDRDRLRLGTPDLFRTGDPCVVRTTLFRTGSSYRAQPGERLLIRCEGAKVSAFVDLVEVGQLIDPPADVVLAVNESGGYAHGLVESVLADGAVAEVSIW